MLLRGWLTGLMDLRRSAGTRVSRRQRTIHLLALGLTFALAAAACGSGDAGAPTAIAAVPADSSSDAADSADSDEAESTPAADTADEAQDGSPDSDGTAEAAGPVENLFPDLNVLNVTDGSTVNLASTLIGGDKATLLWFWAPH